MKGKVKFAVIAVLFVFMVVAAAASSASAAEVIFQNTLDNRVTVAVLYYDRATGLWTAKGWWHVDGNTSKTINIDNVDASKAVYYHAYYGNTHTHYVDKSTLNSDPVNRFVRREVFEFNTTGRPSGTNVRIVPFYRSRYSEGAGAHVVRIDTRPVG